MSVRDTAEARLHRPSAFVDWLSVRSRRTPNPALWAYLVPSLVAAVAVQFWFRGGTGLAGGDLAPPVAPSTDYLTHWNQLQTGAGSPGTSIAGLLYYEGLRLFDKLGFGDVWFQRLWLTVLFASCAAAVVFLARQLLDSPLAAAVAGFLATFNAYHLTTQFDPVPLVALVAAAVLGGLVIQAARGDGDAHPFLFALSSLMLAFVFANPPHVLVVLAWVVVSALLALAAFGRAALGRIGRFFLLAGPLAVLLNLWWIIPALLTITGSVFAEQYAAPGVAGWAWTHARNSIQNVLTFTSSWAWNDPEYFPFTSRLQKAPFEILQFTLPAAACLGLIVAGKRTRAVAWLLAAVGLFSIWFLKGLHAPIASSNMWFYDHVPGAWLFRDPSKLSLVLVLVFSLLGAIAVAEAGRASVEVRTVVAAVFVGGALIYAYPLLTGSVIADKRPLLPPSHVALPDNWPRAAAYLDSQSGPGKVVVLPRLDYYQTPTTWGYYGASFLHQLIQRPVIEPSPGGYFATGGVTALVDALQDGILNGKGDVTGVMQALGVRYVLLRRDLDTSFPGRSFVPPARLARALRQTPQLRHVRSFGFVDLYEARKVAEPEVYPATPIVQTRAANDASLYRALRLGPRTALVRNAVQDKLAGVPTGAVHLLPELRGRVTLTVEQRKRDTVVRIERPASRPRILRYPRVAYPLRVVLGTTRLVVDDATPATITSAPKFGRIYRFAPVQLPTPIQVTPSVVRHVGDCNHYDDRSAREVGLRARVVERSGEPTVQLSARDHSACIAIPIEFRPNVPSLLRLEYRTVVGAPARVCVWEEKPQRCATLPSLESAPGWHKLRAVVRGAPGSRTVLLFLYADGGGDTTTTTEYRNLSIKRGWPYEAIAIAPATPLPRVSYRRVAPYEFKAHVTNARRPFLLVAAETYAPGWRVEAKGRSSNGVEHLRVNGYANGWRIPWKGTYDITIKYGPERYAQLARRADLVLIPLSVLGWLAWRLTRRYDFPRS